MIIICERGYWYPAKTSGQSPSIIYPISQLLFWGTKTLFVILYIQIFISDIVYLPFIIFAPPSKEIDIHYFHKSLERNAKLFAVCGV